MPIIVCTQTGIPPASECDLQEAHHHRTFLSGVRPAPFPESDCVLVTRGDQPVAKQMISVIPTRSMRPDSRLSEVAPRTLRLPRIYSATPIPILFGKALILFKGSVNCTVLEPEGRLVSILSIDAALLDQSRFDFDDGFLLVRLPVAELARLQASSRPISSGSYLRSLNTLRKSGSCNLSFSR
ncbi:hypothetical protein [Bradyrhizobium roseum]|uniref:hypothetical protein n=1 Tax=Bradyrhizobium roseum TaxID=3056648 RepID=UPI00262D3078|nr:hypothetical protein [Bradyrhizobium roseus]WKA28197.1 hypothetical protein QUH67_32420 [Bradyrhizobium roseus]